MEGQRVKNNTRKSQRDSKIKLITSWQHVEEVPPAFKRLMELLLTETSEKSGVEKKDKLTNEQRFEDKVIQCKICGQTFIFTAGEQLFYSDRNLAEPKRCPSCRSQRHIPNSEGGSSG